MDRRWQHGDQMSLMKIMPPPELDEERWAIQLYELGGCVVIKFSQRQRAQQTRGIADLLVLCPKLKTSWWHEIKRRQGPEYKKVAYGQTPHQRGFQVEVEAAGMVYIIGPVTEAEKKMKELGLMR